MSKERKFDSTQTFEAILGKTTAEITPPWEDLGFEVGIAEIGPSPALGVTEEMRTTVGQMRFINHDYAVFAVEAVAQAAGFLAGAKTMGLGYAPALLSARYLGYNIFRGMQGVSEMSTAQVAFEYYNNIKDIEDNAFKTAYTVNMTMLDEMPAHLRMRHTSPTLGDAKVLEVAESWGALGRNFEPSGLGYTAGSLVNNLPVIMGIAGPLAGVAATAMAGSTTAIMAAPAAQWAAKMVVYNGIGSINEGVNRYHNARSVGYTRTDAMQLGIASAAFNAAVGTVTGTATGLAAHAMGPAVAQTLNRLYPSESGINGLARASSVAVPALWNAVDNGVASAADAFVTGDVMMSEQPPEVRNAIGVMDPVSSGITGAVAGGIIPVAMAGVSGFKGARTAKTIPQLISESSGVSMKPKDLDELRTQTAPREAVIPEILKPAETIKEVEAAETKVTPAMEMAEEGPGQGLGKLVADKIVAAARELDPRLEADTDPREAMQLLKAASQKAYTISDELVNNHIQAYKEGRTERGKLVHTTESISKKLNETYTDLMNILVDPVDAYPELKTLEARIAKYTDGGASDWTKQKVHTPILMELGLTDAIVDSRSLAPDVLGAVEASLLSIKDSIRNEPVLAKNAIARTNAVKEKYSNAITQALLSEQAYNTAQTAISIKDRDYSEHISRIWTEERVDTNSRTVAGKLGRASDVLAELTEANESSTPVYMQGTLMIGKFPLTRLRVFSDAAGLDHITKRNAKIIEVLDSVFMGKESSNTAVFNSLKTMHPLEFQLPTEATSLYKPVLFGELGLETGLPKGEQALMTITGYLRNLAMKNDELELPLTAKELDALEVLPPNMLDRFNDLVDYITSARNAEIAEDRAAKEAIKKAEMAKRADKVAQKQAAKDAKATSKDKPAVPSVPEVPTKTDTDNTLGSSLKIVETQMKTIDNKIADTAVKLERASAMETDLSRKSEELWNATDPLNGPTPGSEADVMYNKINEAILEIRAQKEEFSAVIKQQEEQKAKLAVTVKALPAAQQYTKEAAEQPQYMPESVKIAQAEIAPKPKPIKLDIDANKIKAVKALQAEITDFYAVSEPARIQDAVRDMSPNELAESTKKSNAFLDKLNTLKADMNPSEVRRSQINKTIEQVKTFNSILVKANKTKSGGKTK